MSWVVGEFVTVIVIIVFGGLAINGFISKTPVNFGLATKLNRKRSVI